MSSKKGKESLYIEKGTMDYFENDIEEIEEEEVKPTSIEPPKDDGVVWHASSNEFNNFEVREVGFHFAETPELAQNAAKLNNKHDAVPRAFRLNCKNTVETTAQKNGFNSERILEDLMERGALDEGAVNQFYEKVLNGFYDDPQEIEDKVYKDLYDKGIYYNIDIGQQAESELISKFLISQGIDCLKYWNTFDAFGMSSLFVEEDKEAPVQPDWSYIVLDSSSISPA